MNERPERPARLAIVGAGLVGRTHARHAQNEANLVAIADPANEARKFAGKLQVAHFNTLQDLLANKAIDGAVIATPNQMHREHALACIRAGIAVLVEKPLADTVEAAAEIVAAGKDYNVPVLVGHHRRHNPVIKKAKQIAGTGQLGRLASAHCSCWLYKPDDYFNASWRRQPGAGPVYINLIHDVDLLLHLCGPVVSVQAMESNNVRKHEVEDTATILLRFASGALATMSVSDTIAAPWSWELSSGENPVYPHMKTTNTMLGGTRASLSIPDLGLWRHEGKPDWWNPMNRVQVKVRPADPLVLQMRHFARVALGLEDPLVPGRDGLAALKVIEAIKQAASTHSLVSL
ncbi:MAG TPA: Gfo/Idh/MocA family oxidoreductase [Rhizobiales bacterium]|nr:Gfo/Idh/MocA family oxidoreductase [Hyphomicrobiales bacterium]